jgi:nitroreductase
VPDPGHSFEDSPLIAQDQTNTVDLIPTDGRSAIVLDAIRNRRSIGKMTDEIPPADLVRQVLEAGTWAPNHHLTEPWRFVVLQGEARVELGAVMRELAAARETDPEKREKAATSAAGKPLRSPVVVAIAVEPSPEPNVPEIEELSAGSAAAQNMLLAADALGLAAIWRSGWMAFTPEVRDHLGLSERAHVLGFIYLGYPAMERPVRSRRSVDEVTTWRS